MSADHSAVSSRFISITILPTKSVGPSTPGPHSFSIWYPINVARRTSSASVGDAVDDKEKRAREAVRRIRKNLPWLFSKEGNRRFFRAPLETMEPEVLVAAAREGDSDAIEILKNYARGARRSGMHVPQALHEFVWEWFLDGPPKAKSGQSPKDTELRKQTIRIMVKIVAEYGFNVSRNAEHRGRKDGPMTAQKLLAEELGLAETTVTDLWNERGVSLRTG